MHCSRNAAELTFVPVDGDAVAPVPAKISFKVTRLRQACLLDVDAASEVSQDVESATSTTALNWFEDGLQIIVL
jgi:hypothetical protein